MNYIDRPRQSHRFFLTNSVFYNECALSSEFHLFIRISIVTAQDVSRALLYSAEAQLSDQLT